jgi:hypothetical protein
VASPPSPLASAASPSSPPKDSPRADRRGPVVTPKTVEYHLRHTYEKLDISSRTQFATALAATNSDAETAPAMR